MFTGIIQSTGEVLGLRTAAAGLVLSVRCELFARLAGEIRLGNSIAISGVCLTVVAIEGDVLRFDLASETAAKTTLAALTPGSRVNIELGLRVGDRLDGHFVLGHVDTAAKILERTEANGTTKLSISLPPDLRPYVAPKGSVTVDGVSLTVGETAAGSFSVYVIPHTLEQTTMKNLKSGMAVNIEIDCLARYLGNLAEHQLKR